MNFPGTLDRGRLALIGIAVATVLLLAVNVLTNVTFKALHVDLTEDGLFTLSDGTRKVLGSIEEPVTIRLYFSRTLGERSPPHATYFARVRELLERYVDISRGRVVLELYNPEPFSDVEDRAVAFGLSGIPLNEAGDLGYFGLAGTNSTDDEEIIAFFTTEREAFLEYDLTRMIHTLANPKKPVVGLLATVPIDGTGGGMPTRRQQRWSVMEQVREFFRVRPLAIDIETIPDDVDLLMIVHPKGLEDGTLYAIDQFVLGGGRALVFVDGSAEAELLAGGGGGFVVPGGSEFNRLLNAWGITLVDKKVAGDLTTARRVNLSRGGQVEVADYVAWLQLTPRNFDTTDVVTGDLGILNLATAGILEKTDGAGTTMAPLVTVGPGAMAIDAGKFGYGLDVAGLYRDFKPEDKVLTLAARVTGDVASAFPDGPPAADAEAESAEGAAGAKGTEGAPATAATAGAAKEAHLDRSVKPINVIVMADVDMLHDQFWVDTRDLMGNRLLVPFANNSDFVVNSLDNLSGGDALIGLRGRGKSSRPFHMVRKIGQEAERRFRAEEQELQTRLGNVRGKLDRLMRREGATGEIILSREDKAAIDTFRQEMVATRRALRDVQHALREDIDRLDAWLKFLNIAAMPLLIGIMALAITIMGRMQRRRRAVET